jgi:hypothetical protein
MKPDAPFRISDAGTGNHPGTETEAGTETGTDVDAGAGRSFHVIESVLAS